MTIVSVEMFFAGRNPKYPIFGRKFAGLAVKFSHLDPVPETAKREPCLSFLVQDQVRINGIEIVARIGSQCESLIHSAKLRVLRIQSVVGKQGYARGVLAERGEGVIKVVATVEIRNVERPQCLGFRALSACIPVRQRGSGTAPPIPFYTCPSGEHLP